jgi:hypothetical protein
MVDSEGMLGVRQNGIGVWPRPGEALTGWFTGINLDAVGKGLELELNLLPIGIFQLGIRQRILSRLASERRGQRTSQENQQRKIAPGHGYRRF